MKQENYDWTITILSLANLFHDISAQASILFDQEACGDLRLTGASSHKCLSYRAVHNLKQSFNS